MRQNHIFSQKMIFEMAHELKKAGKTIGFTHGTFDLFHYGHLNLLEESSKKCDFLIVGLDSDESVKAYKGSSRPIISQEHRLAIVNSISWVDGVFIKEKEFIDDDMTLQLYKELSPDFISIGRNFAVEDKIKRLASKIGASVYKFDKVYPTETTTGLIDRIIEHYKVK